MRRTGQDFVQFVDEAKKVELAIHYRERIRQSAVALRRPDPTRFRYWTFALSRVGCPQPSIPEIADMLHNSYTYGPSIDVRLALIQRCAMYQKYDQDRILYGPDRARELLIRDARPTEFEEGRARVNAQQAHERGLFRDLAIFGTAPMRYRVNNDGTGQWERVPLEELRTRSGRS